MKVNYLFKYGRGREFPLTVEVRGGIFCPADRSVGIFREYLEDFTIDEILLDDEPIAEKFKFWLIQKLYEDMNFIEAVEEMCFEDRNEREMERRLNALEE